VKKLIAYLIMMALLPVAFMVGCSASSPTSSFAPTSTPTRGVNTATNTVTNTATNTATMTPTALQAGPAAVILSSAGSFAVLGATSLTNSGTSTICGYLGLWESSGGGTSGGGGYVGCGGSGLPVSFINDTTAANAQGDLTTAYNNAQGRVNPTLLTGSGELTGKTLVPGVYSAANLDISAAGILYLNGAGYTNGGVFIFQTAGNLTTETSSSIVLSGGALASNVFWQVAGYVQLGATSIFDGNIMCYDGITLLNEAVLNGSALSETALVAMNANSIVN